MMRLCKKNKLCFILANKRIIGMILFIECFNMESRIMM